MLAAFIKALAQLNDPRLRRVLTFGVFATLGAYVALVAASWWGLAQSSWFQAQWAETASHVAAGLLALLLPLPVLPALATTVMSFRLEEVADAVEERHYPQLNWPRPQKWIEVLGITLRFLAVTVAINLLAAPLYLAAFLLFGVSLSAVVGSYLLGREYYEVVAYRRLSPKEAHLLFRNRLGRLWLAGLVIWLLFLIPLVNLTAPVIATAFMVHLFQSLQAEPTGV
jgi:uncharacterized protein involved in cysteine biosynthesis